MRTSIAVTFALAAVALAPSALAQEPIGLPEEPTLLDSQPPFGNRQSFWQLQIGGRASYITDAGYDPFSSDNSLAQASVALSRTLWQMGRFSFAPGIFWDYGTQDSTARGDRSSIDVHRLGLGLEGRYHVFPWLYGLVRVTPGLLRQSETIEDPAAPGVLKDADWVFAFDASAGAAALLGPHGASPRFPLRFWVITEGGYGWAGRKDMVLKPDLPPDETRPVGSLRLGSLALRGGFLRIAAAVTY